MLSKDRQTHGEPNARMKELTRETGPKKDILGHWKVRTTCVDL